MKILNKHRVEFSSPLFGINVGSKHLEIYPGFRERELVVRCDDTTTGRLTIYHVEFEQVENDMMIESRENAEIIRQRLIDSIIYEEENQDDQDQQSEFMRRTFIKQITVTKDGEEKIVKDGDCCDS